VEHRVRLLELEEAELGIELVGEQPERLAAHLDQSPVPRDLLVVVDALRRVHAILTELVLDAVE